MPRKVITHENAHEAVAACMTRVPHVSTSENHETLSRTATDYLRQDMEAHRDELPMGCSASDYRKFVDRCINRVDYRMRAEHSDQACGFAIIPFLSFIASLIQIWRAIRDWLNSR